MFAKLIIYLATLLGLYYPTALVTRPEPKLGANGTTVTFMEPGGDATFFVNSPSFWDTSVSNMAVASDFVHSFHKKSIISGTTSANQTLVGTTKDSGSRISLYIYFVTLPSATSAIFQLRNGGSNLTCVSVRVTSAGVLQLWNGVSTAQIGSNGTTVSTGQWYRISLSYVITSNVVNRFELSVNNSSTISVTNATITNISTSVLRVGNTDGNASLSYRMNDVYIDNSSALTDPGNIFITAKRPNSNGTTNDFSTQVGAGGSGYGSGHSPQVNERPLSTTNGWSMVGAGSAVTEEFNVEDKSTGDFTIQPYDTIVDYMGWVSANSLVGETAQIIVNGSASNISLTSALTIFTKIANSSVYPSGTGADIGIITATTLTTVTLNESGIIVAFIPGTPPPPPPPIIYLKSNTILKSNVTIK